VIESDAFGGRQGQAVSEDRRDITKKSPLFYGWIIVVAGMIIEALGYGSRYSFSVLFSSLVQDFQWSRDTTSLILSVHLLLYGACAPFAGHLVDRVGPRKTMVVGTILMSVGLAATRFATAEWQFFLYYGLLTGVGLCFVGSVSLTTILRNWFDRYRGTAISLTYFGYGGAYMLYPVVAMLIDNYGWRNAFLVEAAVVAVVFLPLIVFIIRYHPREKGLVADGTVAGDTRNAEMNSTRIVDARWTSTDWTLSKAVRTPRFWLLCLMSFSVWGMMQHILTTHHIAFAQDMGYPRLYAASVLSLFGAGYCGGCLLGFISDRIGREITAVVATILGVSGILVLMFISDTSHPWMLYFYAIAAGAGLGMTSPLLPAALTDIYQGPKVGAIIGCVWFSFALGGTVGAWFAGWIFEATGSYTIAFGLAMLMMVTSCAALWIAAPRKVRLVPGQARRLLAKRRASTIAPI
jgi:MFS family permease